MRVHLGLPPFLLVPKQCPLAWYPEEHPSVRVTPSVSVKEEMTGPEAQESSKGQTPPMALQET